MTEASLRYWKSPKRFRVLKFTVSRKMWRGTQVSVMALDNVATEDDKYHKTKNYKVDRHDLLTLEVAVSTQILSNQQ